MYPELYPLLLLDSSLLFSHRDSFPRYDDECFDPTSARYISGLRLYYSDLLDRQKCFVLFISHRWLSPSKDGSGHPDRPEEGHPKFKMLRKAIHGLQRVKLKDMRVILWVDYCCLEQICGIEQIRGIDSLPS